MDSAAWLLHRPRHTVHRFPRRTRACARRPRPSLREAAARDGRRARRTRRADRDLALLGTLELIEIAALLLVLLTVFLAGGVWIAIALMACGYAAMLFVTDVPIGPVL